MKAGDFAQFLRAAGDLAHDAGLAAAASCFEARPVATVAAVVKTLPAEEAALWQAPETLAASLMAFRPLAEAIGKAGAVRDMDAFVAALHKGPRETAKPRTTSKPSRSAAPVASPERIGDYLRELTASLSDRERFAEVFQRLSEDRSVGVAGLKAIALDFARSAAKSRADALKRILARHQNVMGMDAKSRATGGRTAA